ncbi:MAG: hypothetical protein C0603_05715 [Denitrovibrio sp.]|nr:MAG: hypothetical protein C0603_05715 [Denitrovibrio sp.]
MNNKLITGITPSKSLNWLYRKLDENPIYPPAVAEVDGEYFQLNSFDKYSNDYYLTQADTLADALNKSIDIFGASTLNTIELAHLTVICDKFNIDKRKIEAYEFHKIKGDKNFETLKSITQFCPDLQRYLSIKTIPLKTIAVFDKLETDFRRFVKNTVADKDISVQEFRKMVNLLFDMQATANPEDMGPDMMKKLAAKKDMTRISFMKQIQNLTQGLSVNAISDNNFETSELTFSFKASNIEEFSKKAENLKNDIEMIEKLYRFMNEQDIS